MVALYMSVGSSVERLRGGLAGRESAASRKRRPSMIVETRNPPIDRSMPSSSGSFAAPGISRMRSTTFAPVSA
jgi:hypothetical protein